MCDRLPENMALVKMLKGLELRNLGWKVFILKYNLDLSLSEEM